MNLAGKRGPRFHKRSDVAWNDFLASAKSCHVCEVLVAGCRGCFAQHKVEESEVLSCDIAFHYLLWSDDEADTNKEIRFLLTNGKRFEIELFATDDDDCLIPDAWGSIPTYDRTSPRTDSDEAFAAVEEWIDVCLDKEHEFCDSPDAPPLPSRVVDVGLEDGQVRLVESGGKRADYISLSHCWGLEQIITTTNDTIEQRKNDVPMKDLSNTFRDAVLLTRRLGVRYIWIDSLCIIQDNRRDWEIESAKMAAVYSNSYLTIAATHSSSGQGGLFSETPVFHVSGVTPDGEEYKLFFRRRIDHHLEVVLNMQEAFGHPTLDFHPLLTRAWVYQERMLSTRVLHYGPYEMFFECRSNLWCECGRIGYHGSSNSAPTAITKILHADALDSEISSGSWQQEAQYYISRLWRTLVSSYTALNLTKSSDRLPAIGGLARHMAERRQGKYLAGVWGNAIHDDLIWTIQATSVFKRPRPRPRSAPTWSWASVETWTRFWDEVDAWDPEADIQFEEREPFEHYSRINSCEVVPSAVDEYGGISEGSLRISGLTAEGVLERQVETSGGKEVIAHYASFPNQRALIHADYLLDAEGPDQVLPGAKILCLRMSFIQSGTLNPTAYLISLILRAHETMDAAYERIGSLVITTKGTDFDATGGIFDDGSEREVLIL
ncbi:hypothetical protein Cob_v003451 [Colletotrichum orbiculare MAFF 240422]|uniref:Heterokaryon incompatibility domain-containing protein n=1 Tax=Colletotrichum orbiculare (strain 104-T / ATCC 96160 / CBS 514.97 / LARS 414 / MAFF 240422) TaxID=1213857 RepID=A0A484G1B8_COLOR|nr:hypothetical protein Cob_v003451 [Colletotrichum orbiculare MAFF 240422]